MIKIHDPADELELAMIRRVLDSEGSNYYVHNDYFESMRIGPQIELLNKKTIRLVHFWGKAPENAAPVSWKTA